jgi:hypothetical protein
LREQNKKLQQDNQQLKKEKLLNETRKVEKTAKVPTPPSTPRVTYVSPDKDTIISEIRRVFNNETAVKIADCESVHFDPAVVAGPRTGKAGERGVFQIHPVHIQSLLANGFTWDDMFDYRKNIAYAKMLYGWVGQQWYPTWTCAKLI